MNITFKLFATLTDYLPPEARRSNQITLDVAADASIGQIIEPFGMPPKLVHLPSGPQWRGAERGHAIALRREFPA